jgi:hypothetical protein
LGNEALPEETGRNKLGWTFGIPPVLDPTGEYRVIEFSWIYGDVVLGQLSQLTIDEAGSR